MRPDRIVVGEARGGEALDMLQAMNTGHDGSMSTLHANNPHEALVRLETLVLQAGQDLPSRAIRETIGAAIHLIVQQSRLRGGIRRIVSVAEIIGMKDGDVQYQEIFKFNQPRARPSATTPRPASSRCEWSISRQRERTSPNRYSSPHRSHHRISSTDA